MTVAAPPRKDECMVVRPAIFSVDQILSFDLYRLTGNTLSLYRSKDYPLTARDFEQLLEMGCTELYVPESQRDLFYDHTRRRIPRLIEDDSIPLEDKLEILSETSVNILARMLNNPMSSSEVRGVVSQCRNHVRMAFLCPQARNNMIANRAQAPLPIAHAISVANLSLILGMKCSVAGKDQLHEISIGGLLHEIGKTRLDRDYFYQPQNPRLLKDPRLEQYPRIGRDMLTRTETIPAGAVRAVAEHRERLDGTGYPARLKDEQISPMGRIVAICDYYDERISGADGRPASTPFEALSEMKKLVKAFDKDLLVCLIELLGQVSESCLSRN